MSVASMSGLGINRLYAYDADGERTLIRDVNLNPVVYTIDKRDLDQMVIRELVYTPSTGIWSWTKDCVYRSGALLASVGANESTRHYTLDHLGTPRLVTDRCGAQYALFNYFPFGDEITGGNQDGTERMRFTGHERDLGMLDRTNDDLDYMHARYYKPVTAERFLSVDPVGGDPHRPQTWNRYSYVANNPSRTFDRTGTVAIERLPNSMFLDAQMEHLGPLPVSDDDEQDQKPEQRGNHQSVLQAASSTTNETVSLGVIRNLLGANERMKATSEEFYRFHKFVEMFQVQGPGEDLFHTICDICATRGSGCGHTFDLVVGRQHAIKFATDTLHIRYFRVTNIITYHWDRYNIHVHPLAHIWVDTLGDFVRGRGSYDREQGDDLALGVLLSSFL